MQDPPVAADPEEEDRMVPTQHEPVKIGPTFEPPPPEASITLKRSSSDRPNKLDPSLIWPSRSKTSSLSAEFGLLSWSLKIALL